MGVWLAIVLAVASFGLGCLLPAVFSKRANLKLSRKGLLLVASSFAGFFLLYFVLKQFGIDLFRGVPNRILGVILVLSSLSMVFRAVLVRVRSGAALADLGPSPSRTLFLVLGTLTIAVATRAVFASGISAAQGAIGISQGILMLTFGLVRNRICGEGICAGFGLLQWERLAGYQWTDASTLTVDLRPPFWWQERLQLGVPPALVDTVDRVMSQRVASMPV